MSDGTQNAGGEGTRNETLLVSLSPMDREGLDGTLKSLAAAFPHRQVVVAAPGAAATAQTEGMLRVLAYAPTVKSTEAWVLTAPDFVNAYSLAKEQGAGSVLVLGAEAESLQVETLRALAETIDGGADLANPGYVFGAHDAMISAGILYPITRALFGTCARYPMTIDMGLSLRMAETLATVGQRFTASKQADALLWPLNEAASARYNVVEVHGVTRALPAPNTTDSGSLLDRLCGSLFADVDAKAALWQRIRVRAGTPAETSAGVPSEAQSGVGDLLEAYRAGYATMRGTWSEVLPPNTLLGLKRLSLATAESFRMADALWARIVFDFVLAFRMKTVERTKLLTALAPLFDAWQASHLLQTSDAVSSERHIQRLAAAFEADKPYMISRWRWPDRFNP